MTQQYARFVQHTLHASGVSYHQQTNKQHEGTMTDKPNLAQSRYYHQDFDRSQLEPLEGEALEAEMQRMNEENELADRMARENPNSLYNSYRHDTRTLEQIKMEETEEHLRRYR